MLNLVLFVIYIYGCIVNFKDFVLLTVLWNSITDNGSNTLKTEPIGIIMKVILLPKMNLK